MRNTFTGTLAIEALATATVDNDPVLSSAIDLGLLGNNFRDLLVVVKAGTLADGTFAVTVTECDTSDGSYTAVASSRVLGSLPAFDSSTDDGALKSFGVRPTKRYVKVTITPSDGTDGGPFTVTAVLGNGSNNPPVRA